MRDEGCTGPHHKLEDEGNRYSWAIRYTIANDITSPTFEGEGGQGKMGEGGKKKRKKSETRMSVREIPLLIGLDKSIKLKWCVVTSEIKQRRVLFSSSSPGRGNPIVGRSTATEISRRQSESLRQVYLRRR